MSTFFLNMKKNWAVGRIGIRIHGMTTRTRAQSLFTTHSREKERARIARTFFTAFSRSQSSFFTSLRSRGWFNNLFFPRKRRKIFKIHSSWKPTKQKPARYRKGSKRDEREQREKGKRARDREKERKKEHAPVDLRAVCLVRAIVNVYFCADSFFSLSVMIWKK